MMLVMMMVMVSVMSMNHDRSEDYKDEGDADDAGDETSPSFYERCWSNDDDDGDVDLPHAR